MSETRDMRDELIGNLIMWAVRKGLDPAEAQLDFCMLLNNVEVTSRSTEVAILEEDRNEYLLKKFLIAKQVKGCTERTLSFYKSSLIFLLNRIGKTVDDIAADDIRYYMAIRLRKDKVSKVTLGNEIRNASSFFTWLYTEELLPRNPMAKIDRIKKVKTKKEALTEIEIEKLRMAAIGERDKLLIELLLSTGCRVSEVAQILISEIDKDRILVHGKGQKDRYVYLNARAQLSLQIYLNERKDTNPYLFPGGMYGKGKGVPKSHTRDWWKEPKNIASGRHLDKGTIEQATRRIAKRAGVERANPHKFRRTCATMALRRGMPLIQVSQMLGHADVGTTQIYLDISEDELHDAHKKYVI